MKQTIKWGIIGCGEIANKFAESASGIDSVEVVAAASRTPGKAESFARKHSIKSYYSDYIQILNNDEVDAIYIATTHNFHYKNAKQVLESNKSILCEKPFTVNSREMKILIDMAKSRKLFMMEAMWTRFLPVMVQIRTWLAEEKIGKIKQIRATFGFLFPSEPTHRLLNLKLAGGALLDAGIYPLSFANMVMREKPVEIKALGEIGQTGVDEQSSYIFKYKSGCLAFLNSTVNAPVDSKAEIIGSKGKIIIPKDFLGAQNVILHLIDHEPVEFKLPFDEKTGFKYEIEAASESIRSGLLENETMPLSDTLQLQETIDVIKSQLGLVYANDHFS
ncbi:MAG: Gfo/Idh/MocA family oxidoreductase [Spirochaetaceae bacterium]|jgi:dihydrodiol dehydrogenase / D-xylose 1-dehydrogenase (NADP)|nr:Gfo/Idh/MocA family oxidoreductase [Spirochaetaceae bacterium]